MAPLPNPWLQDAVVSDLLLGNLWLEQKISNRSLDSKSEPDWRGLYHDNGSRLDIINDVGGDQPLIAQVVRVSPLTIADTQASVEALVTTNGLFSEAHLYTFIRVLKYTLQATPFGPPRSAIRLLLNAFEWQETPWWGQIAGLEALPDCEEVNRALKKLQHTRAHEIRSLHHLDSNNRQTPDPMEDNGVHDASPDSQSGFGTQLVPQTRQARQSDDRLEHADNRNSGPVAATSTRHASSRSINNNTDTAKQQLLYLLRLMDNTTATVPVPEHNAPSAGGLGKRRIIPAITNHEVTKILHSECGPATGNNPLNGIDKNPTMSSDSSGPELPRDTGIDVSLQLPKLPDRSPNSNLYARDAEWMQGLDFDYDSSIVDRRQRALLAKPESWAKSLPSFQFPNGNIPIEILNDISVPKEDVIPMDLDAGEGALNLDTESGCPAGSEEEMDAGSSPDPDSNSDDEMDQEDSSAPISWSDTPSPVLEKHRPKADQVLPPDSSGLTHDGPGTPEAYQLRASTPSPAKSSIQSSPSPLRIPSEIDESDEDMEEAVPHGLGEDLDDLKQHATHYQSGKISMSFSGLTNPKSVIQVKETPYLKRGQSAPVANHFPSTQKQDSSGTSEDTSSTSVVPCTFKEQKTSDPKAKCMWKRPPGSPDAGSMKIRDRSVSPANEVVDVPMPDVPSPLPPVPKLTTTFTPPDSIQSSRPRHSEQVINMPPRSSPPALGYPTETSSTVELRTGFSDDRQDCAATSAAVNQIIKVERPGNATTKRKPVEPTIKIPRKKRREIKIMGFHRKPSAEQEPSTSLEDEGAGSARACSPDDDRISAETGPKTATRSLSPLPHIVPLEEYASSPSTCNSEGKVQTKPSPSQSIPMAPRPNITLLAADESRAVVEETILEVHPSVATEDPPKEPGATIERLSLPPAAPDNQDAHTPRTIFDKFHVAYPGYHGSRKHFITLCKQIYALDFEDRMVPKWQWDDYLIRERTEYRAYVLKCLEEDEEHLPYQRFYKDHVRDFLYTKGILKDRKTVIAALEELGEPMDTKHAGQGRVAATEIASPIKCTLDTISLSDHGRRSLPWVTTSQTKVKIPRTQNIKSIDTPSTHALKPKVSRHSLPSSTVVRETPHNRLKPRESSRASLDLSETTGNPFRDFAIAQRRMASWTGDTKFNARPWPQSIATRRTIEVKTRKNADVLSWKDEL